MNRIDALLNRTTAFALALVVTLATLASVDRLATQDTAPQLAQQAAASTRG